MIFFLDDIVIYTHDYSVPTPPGEPNSPAVIQHWTTSGAKQAPCVDGEGNMFYATYDINKKTFDRGLPIAKTDTITKDAAGEDEDDERPTHKTKSSKGKKAAADDWASDDDERPTRKTKSSKGKKKATADDSASDVSPEEEESMSPPPTTRVTRSHTFQQEGGGRKPPRADADAPAATASKPPRAPAAAVPAATVTNPPRAPAATTASTAPASRPKPRPAGAAASKAHTANPRSRSDDESPSPRPSKKVVSFMGLSDDEEDDEEDDLPLTQLTPPGGLKRKALSHRAEEVLEPPKKRSKETPPKASAASTSTRTQSKGKGKASASSSLPPVSASPRQTMSHVEIELPRRTTAPSTARSRTTTSAGAQSRNAHASGSRIHASGSPSSPRELRSHTAGATRPLLAPAAAPAPRRPPGASVNANAEARTLIFEGLTPAQVELFRSMVAQSQQPR